MLVSASSVFVTAPAVFVAVPFLAVRAAMLMAFPFGASARVDVSEVERVGLGQIAHFELYGDPVRGVLEGGRAANARVALGVHLELHTSALVMSSVRLLPTLALATTATPNHKERGRKHHDALEEQHRYPPHRGGRYHRSRGYTSSELRWRTHRRRYLGNRLYVLDAFASCQAPKAVQIRAPTMSAALATHHSHMAWITNSSR